MKLFEKLEVKENEKILVLEALGSDTIEYAVGAESLVNKSGNFDPCITVQLLLGNKKYRVKHDPVSEEAQRILDAIAVIWPAVKTVIRDDDDDLRVDADSFWEIITNSSSTVRAFQRRRTYHVNPDRDAWRTVS